MIISKTENSLRFHIETLKRPEELIEETLVSDIAQNFTSKIEYIPNLDEKLIDGGFHAFLYGLYLAYAEHRPFTLSPDMIWLLILQGISNHVNHSKNTGNDLFPQLTGGTISIKNKKIILGNPESPWHETTEEFSQQIEKIVGSELVAELRSDFSTTTLASKVVSEITIMDTFKAYFKYIIHGAVCGIPEMTLEGTLEDWNHLLHKLEILHKYDLSWWYHDLKSIVEKIRNTADANIDNAFWMQIFKIHTVEEYGSPKYIDGWITKFFPFGKNGGRINLTEYTGYEIKDIFESLPKQVINVGFTHAAEIPETGLSEETDMEYWGGFMGISQDTETQCLKPEINWFVSHAAKTFERDVDTEKESSEYYRPAKIFYNINEIPEEVFEKQTWEELGLFFLDKVSIPERFKDIEFRDLHVGGEIEEATKEFIKSNFDWKRKRIYINGERLGEVILSTEVYQRHLKEIREKYIPKTGSSFYIQGEMLRVVEKLEADNFQEQPKISKECRKSVDTFLEKYLYDEAVYFDHQLNDTFFALGAIHNYADLSEVSDETYAYMKEGYIFLKERIVDWYLHHGATKFDENPALCV
jgi:hypothetical protein